MKQIKWVLSLYIAIIFVQSLFFKFSQANETVHIFTTLGQWSGFDWFSLYGAYGVGTIELIAAIALFTSLRLYGALVAAVIMSAAIFFHLLTPLGIKMPEFDTAGHIVGDDGGLLFYNACGILVAAGFIAVHDFCTNDNKLKSLVGCRKSNNLSGA